MDETTQQHLNSLTKALAAFQLIESFLKLHIQYSLKLASAHLFGKVPFHFSGAEYEAASLERLLTVFRKLTDNTSLASKLEKLKEKRNYCAHRAILDYLGDPTPSQKADEMEKIATEAWHVFFELVGETSILDRRIKAL